MNPVYRVLKWYLDRYADTTLIMPCGSQLLSIQVQDGQPVLYTRVLVPAPSEPKRIIIATTGEPLDPSAGAYIGTAVLNDGGYVVHYFEALS